MTQTYRVGEFSASSHMTPFLNPCTLRERLRLASRALRTHEYDTLAFRGMSGVSIGPALAARLNKQMILVRKEDDDSHSSIKTEGYRTAKRYIIVDDFVDSGDTMRAVISSIKEFAPRAECLGLLQVTYITYGSLKAYHDKPYRLVTRDPITGAPIDF